MRNLFRCFQMQKRAFYVQKLCSEREWESEKRSHGFAIVKWKTFWPNSWATTNSEKCRRISHSDHFICNHFEWLQLLFEKMKKVSSERHWEWLFVEIGWNVMRFFFFHIFRLTKRTLMSASRTKQWFDCGQTATNVIGIFWNGSITSFVCFGWTVYFVLPKMHCLPSLFQPVVLTFFAHRRCSNAFLWLEWRRQTNWYIGKLGE